MSGFILNFMHPLFSQAARKRGFACAKIILEWENVVGSEFASYCKPDKIIFPKHKKNDGTLYLMVDPVLAFRFEYIKDLVIEKINMYFGYKAVSRIKIMQVKRNNLQ